MSLVLAPTCLKFDNYSEADGFNLADVTDKNGKEHGEVYDGKVKIRDDLGEVFDEKGENSNTDSKSAEYGTVKIIRAPAT